MRVPFFLGKNGVSTRGTVNTHSENALAGEVGGAAGFGEDVAHAADLGAYSAELAAKARVEARAVRPLPMRKVRRSGLKDMALR